VGGGKKIRYASDRDKKEGVGARTSRHTEKHSKSGADIPESRTMEGGGKTGGASARNEKKGVGAEGLFSILPA
jgi:hypothetical protein